MKKFMVSFIFILFLFGSAAAMTLNLDLSESSIAPTGQETITINNLSASVDGMPLSGKYWIEFVWDPVNLVFVPVDAGEEIPPKTQYWSFNAGSSSHTLRYQLASYPMDRIIYVSYTQVSGTPYVCYEEVFIQGNNSFELTRSNLNNSTALITFTSAFDGCGYIYEGQRVTATISNLPAWFDFSEAFMVSFGGELTVCEPDGTTHK